MAAIHVRGVPDSTLAALKERAERHGHSMQQEVREILDAAAAEPVAGEKPAPIRLVTVTTSATSRLSREDIYGDEGR